MFYMKRQLKHLGCVAAATLTLWASFAAHAQSGYPNKTARIIIPFGTGGTNIMARWLAPKLS